ncbi:hypothetical protein HUG20_05420 [Salicibibacter cibi]|uniref:Uncharacterized protein n=1 Tax=Salicibibacter cibi TaxID=2743001 RepID=A0A7T7CET0_9BACI|nr:hypothetical protein [Salicibibacter cibi]QQK79383.1 hypothetical protein HUG20_05420 [Salicibibacter cibi]
MFFLRWLVQVAVSWRPNERLAFVFGRHDHFMKTGSPASKEDIRSLTRVFDTLTRAVTVYPVDSPGVKSQSGLPVVGVITYFSLSALVLLSSFTENNYRFW